MNEPTNHLDIRSREALETALADYDGTLLMVSHDRYFINKIADRIVYLTPDGITKYDGNYDDFVERRQEEAALIAESQQNDNKINDYQLHKQQEAERRKLQNRFGKVEKLIEETDDKITVLKKEFENPDLSSDFEKLGEIQSQIYTS